MVTLPIVLPLHFVRTVNVSHELGSRGSRSMVGLFVCLFVLTGPIVETMIQYELSLLFCTLKEGRKNLVLFLSCLDSTDSTGRNKKQ